MYYYDSPPASPDQRRRPTLPEQNAPRKAKRDEGGDNDLNRITKKLFEDSPPAPQRKTVGSSSAPNGSSRSGSHK